ncbi:hypothetical protein AEAC466_02740 [Asticcacaulis sp. AC466]|uniref:autotransporter outer membrane beta-barrel domain-containing protein n=1 Tax=Asticcacaulis sp. AC466 TaxID=1282362 RepID=UPI0003C3E749|nr:autotransporter outer membrane beta-barrel domain-containing protein [Asticcacaulis sp. AC466]ESQ86125.1 hypothetical protein AEAC466_02740 [Asticcacaulis sp. AC466]
MRKHALFTATAIGIVMSGSAFADTTVSSGTTTPLSTSTAGDTTVTSDGTITLTSGTAITVDSNNKLDFEGKISMSGSDSNSTGILITDVPNRTAGLTLTGAITVTDNYTASDTTGDGIVDAPWAEGTARYGLHSIGASPFKGDIDITNTASFDVEGNQSYGIRFENLVDGAFTYAAPMTLIGDQSTGIALDKGVTGNVYLSGSVNVLGADSSAITLKGPIGGSLIIDGTYTGTGYASTTLLAQTALEALTPSLNLLQSGPLVSIEGNVANGILFSSAITDTVDGNTDEDGNGLVDTTQTTAALTQYGSAPALSLGSSSGDITIGGLTFASTAISPPAVNYGLLIRGSVSAYGVYSGVDTTAIRIGGTGYGVNIANGFGISGTVHASGYGANSTALSLLSGTTTPRLDVTGTVTASTSTATTSTTTNNVTTYSTAGDGTTATALSIASGASLPTVTVGQGAGLYATTTGSTANATAIVDNSNTLTTITNAGKISATITATDNNGDGTTEAITGTATAIDAHTNTVGLTLTQTDPAPNDDTIAAPYIYGNILLGSGEDHISSSGGYIYGNIDFGAGTGSFSLTDKATFLGKLTSAGDIAMNVDSGSSAGLLAGSSAKLSSLHVGGDASLALTLSVDAPTSPILTNSGTAVFDDGAKLYLTLDKLLNTPTAFTVMTGSSISLGTLSGATLEGYIPYLYHADLVLNNNNTVLYANFRVKTQAEAGYSDNQYAAMSPVLAVVAQDSGAQSALLSQTTKTGFDQIYNQYLPDYSGENIITLSLGAAAINRSLSNLTFIPDNNGGQYWLQEYGYSTNRQYGETAGFKSTAFSFAGGREHQVYGNQMVGTYLSLTGSSPRDTFSVGDDIMSSSDLTIGAYWRIKTGGLKAWTHAGAGYTEFDSTRTLVATTVSHTAKAKWNGYSVSAGAGTSYDVRFGKLGITPQALIDYYQLNENSHSETGGGDYFDLDIAKRSGHLLSSTALVNVSYNGAFLKPEIWAGYKQNISADLPETIANFVGGDSFTLNGGHIQGGGPVAGFRISTENPYSYFALEAQYEQMPSYTNTSVSLRTRFQF